MENMSLSTAARPLATTAARSLATTAARPLASSNTPESGY